MIVDVIVPIIPPQARNSVPLGTFVLVVLGVFIVALVLRVILNKYKL